MGILKGIPYYAQACSIGIALPTDRWFLFIVLFVIAWNHSEYRKEIQKRIIRVLFGISISGPATIGSGLAGICRGYKLLYAQPGIPEVCLPSGPSFSPKTVPDPTQLIIPFLE
ncbi:MAG TPA: hypothetical protein VMC42_10140 [Methanoregulaceae archaeon]|nr:hypothetical protein [Methanoregulaceae archaeon]